MDKVIIRNSNNRPLIFFDSSYGHKLDMYSKNGLFHLNYESRTNGVNPFEFIDYLINLFSQIKITDSVIKNSYYDFSNEYNSFIYKFNTINFDINSIIKDNKADKEYYTKKREIIYEYYNRCINNLDGNSLTGLIELINKFYMFQVKVFKANELFIIKDDLFENLKDVCSSEIYNYYKNLYESYLKSDVLDIEKLENLFLNIQSIILDDWKKNMSSVADYKLGAPFRFICHSTYNVDWTGDYDKNYVSASLLTENHNNTYNQPFGLIMNPDDIIMASSEDLYIDNNSNNISNLYNSGVLPIVHSFKNVNDNTINYNEVVLDKFNPIGIFCISDGSKELNPYYLNALKLKENFPDLPFVDLDVSFFANEIETKLCRDGLVDRIEEELGIYSNVGERYYDYFNYFWDDFLSLKMSDYNSEDIINLFKKYYNLLNIDLDDLLNSDFDDDFVLKLIGANSRYNSINNIINNSFDGDDIKTFYELYSDLGNDAYNRLNRLFPNITDFINCLDDFLASYNYDLDSFNILKNFKTFNELISFFNEFYGNYNDSSNKINKKNTYN